MVFEDNFVQVTDRVMIDPVLKLVLNTGRFNDDGWTQEIRVDYDPEIHADCLMVPMTEDEKKSYGIRPGPDGHLWPFKSDKRVHLFSYLYQVRPNQAPSQLDLEFPDKEFDLVSKIIVRNVPKISKEYAELLCINILRSVVKMQTWDSLVRSYNKNPPNAHRQITDIAFHITNELASYVGGATGESFERVSDTYCLFAMREARS
jgi:hypothetical protein